MTRALDYRGNFEVHLTVRAVDSLAVFRDWCAEQQCKCVHIILARGLQAQQPMATWRRSHTALPKVLAEATHRAAELEQAGFPVVRVKIEADPDNDDVPDNDSQALMLPPENYFEHHIKLKRKTTAGTEQLLPLCLEHGAHLSHNAWREASDGFEERFITLRCYRMGRTSAAMQLHDLYRDLEVAGEQIIDIESEYTVYDSNLALDAGWLPSEAH
jgi:hypothetical protein